MSATHGDTGSAGVPGGRPEGGPRSDCHQDPGALRQRAGPGIRRGVLPGLLATGLRQVEAVAEFRGQVGGSDVVNVV